ncbi:MAG: hypothetical protein E6109_15075 [Ruminococcus sp.]|nr:hypothetical protein [Ruminococcus sp.]
MQIAGMFFQTQSSTVSG